MWIWNPPDPCCNPPAGYCQCQPCSWKVTFLRGPLTLSGDVIAPDPYPVLRGASQHSVIKRHGGVTTEGPPWYRLWRGLSNFQVVGQGPAEGAWMMWWFGYWRWSLPAGWVPKLRETWGLAFRGVTNDRSGGIPPRTTVPYLTGSQWLHLPDYSGKWNCWGENRLYYVGDTFGEFDSLQYATVEPNLS